MAKAPRDIFGEYDPPYNINSSPIKEQREAAEKIMAKHEKWLPKETQKTSMRNQACCRG